MDLGRTRGWSSLDVGFVPGLTSSLIKIGAPNAVPLEYDSAGADSDLPRDSSGNFDPVGVLVPLLFSEIPRWLKLRSPIPSVLTASSFSSIGLSESVFSASVSTTGLSTSFISGRVPLLFLFPPGATDVLAILLLNVFAAFCAAEKTVEKNPPCWLGLGFSGVGVNGADVIFDNLLGPRVTDPDLTLRCDIMLPDGDVTTLGFETADSEVVPS